jgi:hypothetical protein
MLNNLVNAVRSDMDTNEFATEILGQVSVALWLRGINTVQSFALRRSSKLLP